MRRRVTYKSKVSKFKVKVTVRVQRSNPASAGANFIKSHKNLTIIRRYVIHNIYGPKLKVKVRIWDQRPNYLSAITLKSTKAIFIHIPRQIRHHVRVCHAEDTGSHTQGQGQRGQMSSCFIMSL